MILKIKEIVSNVIKEKKTGDILIFLSGEKEIKETNKRIARIKLQKKINNMPFIRSNV